jgi:hypothetical protein
MGAQKVLLEKIKNDDHQRFLSHFQLAVAQHTMQGVRGLSMQPSVAMDP